jgi:MFS transporter, ACS family, glucarate transporter
VSVLAPGSGPRPGDAPTNARRTIIAFGAAIAFLSFLDRAAISQAAPSITREMHLSPARMGLIFSAFGFTYAAFEMPSGWLCDRFGVRKLLTRVVLLWSLFTATTGVAWNFPSLFVSRLLFGAGESGCFPALASMFRTWLPPRERNSAEGIKAACARWGAAIAPALITALYAWFTWRQVFVLLGLAGAVLGLIFARWYRDDPATHSSVNAAELALLPVRRPREVLHDTAATWSAIVRSRSVWALGLQWFAHYYGFYFYITWLPLYLYRVRGFDLRPGALAAGLPLFTAGLGSLCAGWAASALATRMGSVARARKLMGYISYGGAAALLLLFTQVANPTLAIVAMSLSSFAAEFSTPISWTTAMDIGGDNVGAVSGFMNTLGQLGASVAPAITGFLLQFTGNGWNLTFYASALIYAAGAVCWMIVDPTTPLDIGSQLTDSKEFS